MCLKAAYANGLVTGIEASEVIFTRRMLSIDDYLRQLSERNPIKSCQAAWDDRVLAGKCYDCRLQKNSCICLFCFLQGGHKNHRSYLTASGSGNCDCGDASFWKVSGCCPHHPGPEKDPDIVQLPVAVREKGLVVFEFAWCHLIELMDENLSQDRESEREFKMLVAWIKTFIRSCDGMRRIVARALCENAPVRRLLSRFGSLSKKAADVLFDMLGCMYNDAYFSVNFSEHVINEYLNIAKSLLEVTQNVFVDRHSAPLVGLDEFMRQGFHFMNPHACNVLVPADRVPWDKIWCEMLDEQIKFIIHSPARMCFWNASESLTNHWAMSRLYKAAAVCEGLKDRYRTFLVTLAEILTQLEGHMRVRRLPSPTADPDKALMTHVYYQSSLQRRFFAMTKHLGYFCKEVYLVYARWIKENVMSGKFDSVKTPVPVCQRCVFGLFGRFTPDCTVALLATRVLRQAPNPREAVMNICCEEGLDFDEFCIHAAVLPVRYIAACWLSSTTQLYNECPESLRDMSKDFQTSFFSCKGIFMQFIETVQLYFAICQDKQKFLDMILHTFGFYEPNVPRETMQAIEVEVLFFVAGLITDRICWRGKRPEIVVQKMISSLKENDGTMSISSVCRELRPYGPTDENVVDMLEGVITQENGKMTLVDDSQWHMVALFGGRKQWYRIMNALITNQSGTLQNFPEYESLETPGCDLVPVLQSPTLFALIYDVLYNSLTRTTPARQLAAGLLVLCAIHCPDSAPEHSRDVIVADTFDSLVNQAPTNFNDFIRTPIVYKRGYPNTILQILTKLGPFGANVLSRARISTGVTKALIKPDVAAIKEKILSEFKADSEAFERAQNSNQKVTPCTLCSELSQEHMAYPVMVWLSATREIVGRKKSPGGSQMISPCNLVYGCCHLAHIACISEKNRHFFFDTIFNCKICGGARVVYMPKLSDNLTPHECAVTRDYTHQLIGFLRRDDTDFDPAVCLANHIFTLELRHRNRPEALLSRKTKEIHRQLFLNVVSQQLDTIPRLDHPNDGIDWIIWKTLGRLTRTWRKKHDRPDNKEHWLSLSWRRVSKWLRKTLPEDEVDRLILCRQTILFCHFMLDMQVNDGDDVIDWDVVMSPECLAERFNVPMSSKEPIVLQPFVPIALPNDWIELQFPPYEWGIQDMSVAKAKCLVTGMDLYFRDTERRPPARLVFDFYHRSWNCGTGMLIITTGYEATKVMIVSFRFNKYILCDPVWLNKHGAPDYGMVRGDYLMLDRDELSKVWDDYLSGRVHDKLHGQDDL